MIAPGVDAGEAGSGSALRIAVVCGDRGVAATGRSGASEHLRSVCGGFSELGLFVELWCQRMAAGPPGTAAALPANVRVLEGPRGRLPGFLRKRTPWDHGVDGLAMSRWVLAQARRFQPDLIYERFSLFSSPGLKAARALGVPWVVELNAPLAWEGALFRGLRPSRSLLRRESKALTAADLLVCVSPALRDYAIRRGVPEQRIQVVANGARHVLPAVSVGSPGIVCDASATDSAAPFVLGYAGSFKAWHGLSGSLPALRRLQAAVAPRRLQLDLWGDGPERAAFSALVLEEDGLDLCLRGWGSAQELVVARRSWDAAWVPLATWPPYRTSGGRPVSELVGSFGEPVPAHYFCPLKEAEARAQGIPIWRGAMYELPAPGEPPLTWRQVVGSVLIRSGFPPTSASWDDVGRCRRNQSLSP